MASEDSDELVSRFPTIHGLGDLRDLDETFGRLVPACRDELHAVRELLEVHLLGALHRMLPKERNDRLQQISTSPYDVAQHVLPMIVVPVVRVSHRLRRRTHEGSRGTQRQTHLA